MKIIADYSEMDAEIERIASMPTAEMTGVLEELLAMDYASTNAATHVETGSLKSSEKMTSSVGDADWEGTLEWGGASGGVHNPVKYAIYEHARGGAHDFMANATLSQYKWIEKILEELGNAK